MAAELDLRAISAFSSVPEANISSLLDNPTADLVRSLLVGIESKVKEYEQNKTQKVKLEVELETVVRTSESKAKVLQNSRDNALADSSKLRGDLQKSESARTRLESELEQVRSATANEASETNSLKARISSLESANRDTLALLESKNVSFENLSQDLAAQHQKAVDLRKQITTLEQAVQQANAAVATSKFREQSLQQELDLLKKNNEWLENERKIKADEHSNFRKEKNARISELTRSNEQYISELEALRRSESHLKNRIEDQQSKFEDLLDEIQKLREEKTSSEDALRSEIETTQRLANLQQAAAETAKGRVQELSAALDELREEAADEIGAIRAESESEHADRVAAEEKVAELEASLESLRSELDNVRARPSTPQRGLNGAAFSTPLRAGTPSASFTPSISRGKPQMTFTQLYNEYQKMESEFTRERRTNEQLRSNLDSMVEELENSKPEIEELRLDHDRLQSEIVEMSAIMDSANAEKEAALKELKATKGRLDAKSQETQVLAQQLRDLGSQIRHLMIEQHVRERGETLTREDYEQLEAQASQALADDLADLSETQQVINQRLIIFRNITELQQQNESQLKTIRNLVKQLESNEAKEKDQQHHALQQDVEHLRQQVSTLKDELKSQLAQSNSFAKERDILRSMLTKRGLLKDGVQPADFSRSLPVPRGESPAVSGSGDADYGKLLKELQQHFDTYRREASTDHTSLKTQVDDLTRKNSTLQADISRTVGQLTAANQRYEMLQANYNSLKTENSEIQKRSWSSMEMAAKQELKTQQVAEELVEARGLVDSLRRDAANLKAEKDLWKSVERRLVDDNESLRNERTRLGAHAASLQSIINEREQTDSETRRRLQAQSESLESELQAVKRKLNDEMEENKKASLRREYEHTQSQQRIDDLVTSLGATKEELASAKTARDHLQARVDEMTVELRSAEERLEVLSRRNEADNETNDKEDNSLTKEQELEVEVSELKRDLELKNSELERLNEQVEVYKNISQSSEERLQELSETNDQYREETEATLSEKDAKIKDLEQRIDDISSELNTTNAELSRLHDEQGEFTRKAEEARSAMESQIEQLKVEAEKNIEQAQFNLEASKIQAQIATEAQQNYETELVKHAEAAKTLQIVRDEANQLRLQMVSFKTEAETSKASLEQKDISFEEMRDRYEREITDLRKRREEVAQQNNLLHSQLESVTQQITTLQRDRAALAEGENTANAPQVSAELDKLQEVITYLRREKDIVDVQYQLSTQEAKRLRQQLDFTQSQLDETRLKLDEQRRIEADAERNAISHSKLMDTLNELNLFRESSVTLRAEAKQAKQALADKASRVEEVEGQLQTLQARVAELENLVELREGELKLAQDDRDHWQQRTQNILSKYDRVDPAELEGLKGKIATLESERDQARSELESAIAERDQAKTELQSQSEETQNAIRSANAEQKTRLETQFKEVLKKRGATLNEVKAQLDTALAERQSLEEELNAVKEQLATSQEEVATMSQAQLNGVHDKPAEQASTATEGSDSRINVLEARVAELENSLAAKDKDIEDLTNSQEEKFKARVAHNEGLLNNRLKSFKQEAQQTKATALEELVARLTAEHQKEIESLKAQAATNASAPPAAEAEAPETPASDPQNTDEQAPEPAPTTQTDVTLSNEDLDAAITTREIALYLARNNEHLKDVITKSIRSRVTKDTEALRKQFEEEKAAMSTNGASQEEIEKLEQKFSSEKEAILREAQDRFDAEKKALETQYEESLSREKQALIEQHQEQLETRKLQFDEESAKKIAEQVRNAEQLAEKKSQLKINMAQNSARAATAKLDVVRKSAEETPEKAVGEVWAIAKDAKPAPLPKPATAAPVAASAPPATASSPVKPDPAPTASSTVTAATEAAAPAATPQQTETAPSKQVDEAKSAETGSTEKAKEVPASEPVKPAQPAQNSTQPQQSGIPRPGSFRGRGTSGIPRGRGGAPRGGRGGSSAIPQQANRGGHGSASPGRGGLNPSAAQFTPAGNKRARDEGESADFGQGKRPRGSGAGA
ncbi:hypothetical protein PV10_01597 [Exophiala mesophila]|uniref:Uncharacterized protein n=1 Tax=Exophiala mesophila TaxID=212818 RepID=A0A0D1ZTJ6_EXOME|nr:uncharacterized protein PV10_01597 [Exophiala mesophila]KIV97897.1 hypothetical protein PV10_01597 [Exophiala mesophila]